MESAQTKAILNLLSKHPEGLTITAIAEKLGIHRHTVTKYLKDLILSGKVNERNVGMAKLCFLSEYKEEHNLAENAEKGQAQILLLALLLLSIPVFIIAQNFDNNITGDFSQSIDTTFIPSSSDTVATTTIFENVEKSTLISTTTTTSLPQNEVENSTVLPILEELESNQTLSSSSNETLNFVNETINETVDNVFENNSEISSENLVIPSETIAVIGEEKIDVQLDLPQKVNRGEEFVIKATATNDFAIPKRIKIKWILPEVFRIISNEEMTCVLQSKETCVLESTAIANSDLGTHEIKVRVSYE